MESILQFNSRVLLENIMKMENEVANNQFFRYQVKTMIYLYFTDKYEASINNDYHKFPEVLILFDKHVKYLKHHMFGLKNLISCNNEHVYIDSSFSKKTRNKSVRTIVEFMKPYENFKNPVSIYINDLILNTIKFEKDKTSNIQSINKNELSTLLFELSLIQSRIFNTQLSFSPTIDKMEEQRQLFSQQSSILFKYTNEFSKIINSNKQVSFSVINEKKYKYQKDYCKKTILLNIDLMKSVLNEDTIIYIKTFIDPKFLENIRKSSIQKKYFKYTQMNMFDLLHSFSLKQIQKICKHNLFLLYNSTKIEKRSSIWAFDHSNDIDYYEMEDCHDLCDTEILLMNNKKKIIKTIISDIRLINYYEFQREIFILNRLIGDKNIKRGW